MSPPRSQFFASGVPYQVASRSKALKDLKNQFDEGAKTGNGSHGPTTPNTTSFSISLFSTGKDSSSNDESFFFYYHHTAPSLKVC